VPIIPKAREVSNNLNLAILGHPPALEEKLYVGLPNIGNRDRLLKRFNDIFESKQLTNNGIFVQDFENRIAELTGVRHCIAVNNATSGLQIAIRAMGLSGEVILPSFTFIATAHALQWQGISPIFCDIRADTHNLDPLSVEERITPQTTGIIGVHVWGRPCDIEALEDIASRNRLKLLFDAAHAFGSSYNGKMIGNFGEAEVFSFHATKYINTLEGGAIITNDDQLAHKARMMRNFGFIHNEMTATVGINAKMNEISAAMGITGLESMDEWISRNFEIYKIYQLGLDHIPGIRLMPYDETSACNYQYIILEVDETKTHVNRNQLINILHAENVMARRYFYPGCHRMGPYNSKWATEGFQLPETERIVEKVVALPTGQSVSPENARLICTIIQKIVEHGLYFQEWFKLHEIQGILASGFLGASNTIKRDRIGQDQ
jgi:dTDP-4-amino-4,6-dideoxygalactose transaminase